MAPLELTMIAPYIYTLNPKPHSDYTGPLWYAVYSPSVYGHCQVETGGVANVPNGHGPRWLMI